MSEFKLVQGVITHYTEPRVCNVLQIPDHYMITGVRLPNVLNNQTRPLVGSVVMVASQDAFKSYIIAVVREPEQDFNSNVAEAYTSEDQFRGATAALAPGDVFLQAAGTRDTFTGDGAYLYIGNTGTIEMRSSQLTEHLFIGGETTDEDEHAIIARAANMKLESSVEQAASIQSHFEFDDENNLAIGNRFVTGGSLLTTPISELTMDLAGTITLRNTTAGVDKGVLKIDTSSDIELRNTIGVFHIAPSGNIEVTGTTINLNSGTFGVARLNDLVTSNASTDPAWWTFWSTLSAQIAALPTTPLDGGATLKAGLSTLFSLIPTQIISKITSASVTVTAGD